MKHFIQQAEISKYTSLIEMLNDISKAQSEDDLISILINSTKWVIDFQNFVVLFQDKKQDELTIKNLIVSNKKNKSNNINNSIIIKHILDNTHDRIHINKETIDNLVNDNSFDKMWSHCHAIFASKIPIDNSTTSTLIFGSISKIGFSKNEMLQLNIICNIAQSNLLRIFNNDLLELKNIELENSLKKVRVMQKTIILQEKLASLGAVTAGIAHELKNPLHIILNYTKMLQQQLDEIIDQNKNLGNNITTHINNIRTSSNTILKHSNKADKIITAMMYQKVVGESSFEIIDISNLVHDSLQISYHAMRAKNPIDVVINENIEEGIESNVNSHDLNLSLINLFDNAFYTLVQKYKLEGEGFKPKLDITLFSELDKIKIIIIDNGLGIDKSIIGTVFNPFFTTKDPGEGTGLGLSFVYDVITNHKGSIDIVSEKTTEISITLPKVLSKAA